MFTNIAKPDDEYKKAFSVWVLPKFVNDKDNITHPVSLWQRNSFGEFKGFQGMGASFYAELQKPENKDKLPVVKWTGSETLTMGMGKSTIPHFELVGFKDRPAEFVIPNIGYDSSPSDNQQHDFLPKSDGDTQDEAKNFNAFEDDEIPF